MNVAQKEKTKQALRVFLTYAKTDGEYARRLRNLLSRHLNLHIFTPDMLSAGEDWLSKIKNEVSQCDVFIVLLSPDSINSEWVLSEVGAAWALNKLIIPVVTQPELFSEIPIYLGKYHSLEIKYLEEHPEAVLTASVIMLFSSVLTSAKILSWLRHIVFSSCLPCSTV